MAVPPVDVVYHRYCPAVPPAATSVALDGPHADVPVVVGGVLMVAITAVRILSQVPLFSAT
jgi:hypothetical protein